MQQHDDYNTMCLGHMKHIRQRDGVTAKPNAKNGA